jgi:hypothetical protein
MLRTLNILLLLCLFSFSSSDYEDAITKRSTTQTKIATFEGIYSDVNYDYIDSKKVNLYFILENVPSAYFEHYDSINNIIIIDFYDVKLGSSIFDTISEYPIIRSEYSESMIDLNLGVDGFEPDIRNVVTIKFFTKYKFEYSFHMDEFYEFNLKFQWNEKDEKNLKNYQAYAFNKIIFILFPISLMLITIYNLQEIFN